MTQAHGRDPSTLAALHPTQQREVHYRSYRSSVRLHGSHYMTLRRASRMPESSRDYRPGDPIGLIDWKAYARTDQLIIREIRDEATARVRVVLDQTPTMLWPTPDVPSPVPLPPQKAEVAVRVALHVAYMHLKMGDLVEVRLVSEDEAKKGTKTVVQSNVLKPRSPVDLVSAFERMSLGQFGQEAVRHEFKPDTNEPRPADCVFWIGDALGPNKHMQALALGRRQVLVHVLSSLERAIDWVEGDTSYFDEGASAHLHRKEYQGQVLRHRENYVRHLAAWQGRLAKELMGTGGVYLPVTDRTAIAELHAGLQEFIKAPGGA